MYKSQKKAFTLAEVLISLAILGIIASLTIPTLVTDSTSMNNQYVAGFKKVYAELDYATQQIRANNSGTLKGAFSSSNDIVTKYCKYMKCSKTCGSGAAVSGGCYNAQSAIKMLNGKPLTWYDPALSQYSGFVLADGTLILTYYSPTCGGSATGNPYCVDFHIDVNGLKGPNIYGRDLFAIAVYATNIILYGDGANYNLLCDPASADSLDGAYCAVKVFKEGKMLY